MKEGKKLLIAAHGNSLRGIVKYLDNMSEGEELFLIHSKFNELFLNVDSLEIPWKMVKINFRTNYGAKSANGYPFRLRIG